jgi:hypothetical protein
MKLKRVISLGVLSLLMAATAMADVIDISDVNADDESGHPILMNDIVTIEGVVTVGTGAFADTNEIYVQDATGGVLVKQVLTAVPSVAPGDSVRVTGKVYVAYFKRTFLKVGGGVAGSRIDILSTGNPVPAPLELTARDLALSGEDYEGSYAVVRDVSLLHPANWPSTEYTDFRELDIADADTSCWLWVHPYTDVDGSSPPLEYFDVYGAVSPDPQQPNNGGYGIIPPARVDIRSAGSGAGFATATPEWVFTGDEPDIEISLIGEADVLTRISVAIPGGWSFSGDTADVDLDGAAFATADVVAHQDSTNATLVTIGGANLIHGSPGTITLENVTVASTVGDYEFVIATGVPGEDPVVTGDGAWVHVAATGDPGDVVINELYPNSDATSDIAEFTELHNVSGGTIDISGWVLTDMDDSGTCGGSNLWEFPVGSEIPAGGYIVVARHAIGYYMRFGDNPDYELVDDDYATDPDNTQVPNLTLVSPVDGDSQTSQEIILMGGDDENGAMLQGKRVYEAVYLYTDRLKTEFIDAVEYRNPVYLEEDFCTGEPELGGDNDAYVPGEVPLDYTLGRDAVSTDTNVSAADLILSSTPTPGEVNDPTDGEAPSLVMASAAGDRFVKVEFSEPVDEDDATNISNYALDGDREILSAWLSRDERTVLLYTTVDSSDFSYQLEVSGVADVAGNQMPDDSASFLGHYQHSTLLSEIQAYDEEGLSPLEGERAITLGFVTVPPGVFQSDKTSIYMQDLDGYGINVFEYDLLPDPPFEGDLIEVVGEVVEYISGSGNGATTEITGSDDVPFTLTVHARGFDAVQPAVMRTGDITDEALEGTLITTSGVIMSLEGFAIYIDDGSGSIQAYQNFTDLDFSKYAFGDSISVTGVLLQYDYSSPYFSGYELAPRYESDMEILEAHFVADATVTATARVLDIDEDDCIEISYNGPQASHIAVRIFDLQGRSVTTLYDGWCLGPQRATWDGKDDRGKDVPPGVYICQVQARARTGEAAGDAAVPIVIGMKLQ